jgi:hypothetical protein
MVNECAKRPIVQFEVWAREGRDHAHSGHVLKVHVSPVITVRLTVRTDGLDVAIQPRVHELAFLGRQ